jgi:hypothetical protein
MRAVLVLLALIVALLLPVGPAAASCVGPTVEVTPATAATGSAVTVHGEYFGTDCLDTGPPPAGMGVLGEPAQDVEVVLRHGEGEVVLGQADATSDYAFTIEVTVPPVPVGQVSVETRFRGGAPGPSADLQVTPGEEAASTPTTAASSSNDAQASGQTSHLAVEDTGVGSSTLWAGGALVALLLAAGVWWRVSRHERGVPH